MPSLTLNTLSLTVAKWIGIETTSSLLVDLVSNWRDSLPYWLSKNALTSGKFEVVSRRINETIAGVPSCFRQKYIRPSRFYQPSRCLHENDQLSIVYVMREIKINTKLMKRTLKQEFMNKRSERERLSFVTLTLWSCGWGYCGCKRARGSRWCCGQKIIKQSHFVTQFSINILSVTKYFEEIVRNYVHSFEFAHLIN